MAPSFSKHAILHGAIDYYCLVCENRFETKDNTSEHILTTSHNENLEKSSYEVPEDCIRKIKRWYFCEFCNLLLNTKAKVSLHIAESKHITNKTSQCLKRYGEAIVAFDKVCINKEAWDGLCDETCVICNCEYDNDLEHSKLPEHNIALIQSNILFDNKNIYRMVDETSFHCMTCNSLKALPVNNHFNSLEHKTVYETCQQLATKILDGYQNNDLDSNNTTKNQLAVVHENVKTVEVMETEIVSDKDKKKTAKKSTCKAITKVFNIKKDEEVICKVLKTNNYITRDEKGCAWCILCDWAMDDFKMNRHVNSLHHRNILKLHERRIEKITNTNLKDENKDEFNSPREKNELNNNISRPQSASTERQLNSEEHLSKPKESATKLKSDSTDQDKRSNELSANRYRILDSVQKFQQNNIKINFEINSVMCKRCTLSIDFNYDSINKHIDEHQKENSDRSKILDSLQTFQENNVNINFDMNIAKCQQCLMNIDFDYDSIEKHISEHKQQLPARKEVNCEAKTTDEESDFATLNNLKPIVGENLVFCEKCKKNIPFSLKNMKEHLNGNTHRSCEIEKKKEKKIKLQPLETFVRSITCIKNGIFEDDIINGELCINRLSHFFIGRIPEHNMYRCFYCNVYLTKSETDNHLQSFKHLEYLSYVAVVINVEDEFIRQINSDRYHCGFCNLVVDSWQDMESHLKTVLHREAKISAKWRLEEYSTLPEMESVRHERFSLSKLV